MNLFQRTLNDLANLLPMAAVLFLVLGTYTLLAVLS